MTVKRPDFVDLCSCPSTNATMTMAKERMTRKWEIFQGRNRFYCSGRFMTAPNAGVFLFTVFLITGTSTLFFVFDCKYLAENVTIAIPIIGVFLFVFTMSSLLRTSLSDPGIIPRATSEEAAYVEKQIEVTNSANSPTYRPPPRTKEVLVKGQTIKLKYCFTCKLFRPPRASHCSICDNCVDRFDHHCPWVGNCVGRRNYRFFYMFIVSLAFLAVFIFACAIAHLILITKEERQFLDAVRESPASVIVAVICFFSVWSILGLAGFHTYLTTSNQTTNEDIKGSFTSKRGQDSFNPYSQGNVCLNCFHILCGPVAPSLIDRRGIVTDSYRTEISHPITLEPAMPLTNYALKTQVMQNHNVSATTATELPGIYRQTTETTAYEEIQLNEIVESDEASTPVIYVDEVGNTLENNENSVENNENTVENRENTVKKTPVSEAKFVISRAQRYGRPGRGGGILKSNAGSVTHLVSSEHPLALAPALQRLSEDSLQYKSQPTLNHSPVYNNLVPLNRTLSKSRSYAEHINKVLEKPAETPHKDVDMAEDLCLDPIVLRESHILSNGGDKLKLDNDLTMSEKENSLMSASRLRLLQDTTMIESALDLDSLEDSSVGANSQAGLMKIMV